MQLTVNLKNKFDELVSDDKSKSLEMLLHLQKFMIVFIVLLAVLTTTQFLVLIFWTFLLVNTPQGSKLFLSLLAKVKSILGLALFDYDGLRLEFMVKNSMKWC